jgi:hypothetical protein
VQDYSIQKASTLTLVLRWSGGGKRAKKQDDEDEDKVGKQWGIQAVIGEMRTSQTDPPQVATIIAKNEYDMEAFLSEMDQADLNLLLMLTEKYKGNLNKDSFIKAVAEMTVEFRRVQDFGESLMEPITESHFLEARNSLSGSQKLTFLLDFSRPETHFLAARNSLSGSQKLTFWLPVSDS